MPHIEASQSVRSTHVKIETTSAAATCKPKSCDTLTPANNKSECCKSTSPLNCFTYALKTVWAFIVYCITCACCFGSKKTNNKTPETTDKTTVSVPKKDQVLKNADINSPKPKPVQDKQKQEA